MNLSRKMMFVSDEDDSHQCGKCRTVFHTLEDFLTHKKSRLCTRNRSLDAEDVADAGLSSQPCTTTPLGTCHTTLNTPNYIPEPDDSMDSMPSLLAVNYDNTQGLIGVRTPDAESNDALLPGTSWHPYNNDQKTSHSAVASNGKARIGRPRKTTEIVCAICDYRAVYMSDMNKHMKSEHKLGKYDCIHCREVFHLKKHLVDHLEVCYLNPDNAHIGKNRSLRNKFRSQKHTDNDEDSALANEFPCQACDQKCLTFAQILKHIKADHPSILPGICRFCGQWFSTKNKLFRHLNTNVHPSIPDTVMQKAREQMSSLRIQWIIKKEKLKQYACKKCDGTFAKRPELLDHMKKCHDQGKVYTCETCDSVFDKHGVFLLHMKNAHGIDQFGADDFRCPTCDRTFGKKNHVCRHIDSLHRPVQQVPDEMLAVVEAQPFPSEGDCDGIFTCFVCRTQLASKAKMQKHVQMHRVWCLNTEHGPIPDGVDQLFDKLNNRNTCPTQLDISAPPPAILHGMKPIQVCPDIHSALLMTSSLESQVQPEASESADDHFMTSQNEQNHQTPADQIVQSDFQVSNEGPQGHLSMPLDLNVGTPVDTENVQQQGDTISLLEPQTRVLQPSMPMTLDEVTGQGVSTQNGLDPQQCSTIDQSALRDLVQALGDITNNGSDYDPNPRTGEQESMPMEQDQVPMEHNPVPMEPNPVPMEQDPLPEIPVCPAEEMHDPYQDSQVEMPEDLSMNGPKDSQAAGPSTESQHQDAEYQASNNTLVTNSASNASNCSTITSNKVSITCPYCLTTSSSLMESFKHKLEVHHLVPVFKCIDSECQKIFTSVKEYELHSQVHLQLSFICSTCNEHMNDIQKLISHKNHCHRVISQPSNRTCNLCDVIFQNRDELMAHQEQNTHSTFHCNTCTMSFCSRMQYAVHVESHKEQFNLCDTCGQVFGSVTALNKHKTSVHGNKVFACDKCPAIFGKRQHLIRHMSSRHSEDKPFQCTAEGCDKAFSRKDKLMNHQKTHSDEKPFVCQYCAKSYRYREGLRHHERSHQKQLKLFCIKCDGAFSKPSMLREHMQVAHQLEVNQQMSYPCHHCGKMFPRPERLQRHMEKEHSVMTEWKFNCHICNEGFPGQTSLKSHMKRKHPSQYIPSEYDKASSGLAASKETGAHNSAQLTKEHDYAEMQQNQQAKILQPPVIFVPLSQLAADSSHHPSFFSPVALASLPVTGAPVSLINGSSIAGPPTYGTMNSNVVTMTSQGYPSVTVTRSVSLMAPGLPATPACSNPAGPTSGPPSYRIGQYVPAVQNVVVQASLTKTTDVNRNDLTQVHLNQTKEYMAAPVLASHYGVRPQATEGAPIEFITLATNGPYSILPDPQTGNPVFFVNPNVAVGKTTALPP